MSRFQIWSQNILGSLSYGARGKKRILLLTTIVSNMAMIQYYIQNVRLTELSIDLVLDFADKA